MQQALLDHAGGVISPQLSQLFMICVKVTRVAKDNTHYDSLADTAGYARTIQMTNDKIDVLRAIQANSKEQR